MKRKAISIHIKTKDEKKFMSLSEDIRKNSIDKTDLVLTSDHKAYYKAVVIIGFDDGSKDTIYTMNPEHYKNLYFPDKGDVRKRRINDILEEIENEVIRDRVRDNIEFLEKEQKLTIKPENIRVINSGEEVDIILDNVKMIFK